MRYAPPIKGKPKKQPAPIDLAGSIHNVVSLSNEYSNLRKEVIIAVNSKINELDKRIDTKIASLEDMADTLKDAHKSIIKTADEIEQHIKTVNKGNDGKDADEEKITKNVLAKLPDVNKLKKDILSEVPKIDEKGLLQKFVKAIPENKASLKIIQEKFEIDPISVIEKIMQLPEGKFKLKTENIDGLSQTIRAMQSQLGRGYLHGGGLSNVQWNGTQITTMGASVMNFTGSGVSSVTAAGSTITVNISGIASDLIVGTTQITGGTNTYLLYDNNGVLGEINQNTFQGALTLTTTGSSGAATLIGNTLNIPNYSVAANVPWSGLTAPTANLALSNGNYTTAFTFGSATGSSVNPFSITDTASNTGTGNLVNISTATGSTLNPFAVFAAGSATPSIQVLANGNVGIGTTSPIRALSVSGTGNTYTSVTRTGATASSLVFGAESGVNRLYSWTTPSGASASPFEITIGSTNVMYFSTSGNVGIGTTGPNYKLEIDDNVTRSTTTGDGELELNNTSAVTTDVAALLFQTGGSRRVQISVGNDGNNGAGFLAIATRDTSGVFNERLRVTNTGNVGVGTASPTSTLAIQPAATSGTPSPTAGSGFQLLGTNTFTDNNTAGSGTASGYALATIAQGTLAATNTAVTTTNAYTLNVLGAPKGGTNETLTNATALNIASAALANTTTGYGLQVNAPTGATNNYAATFSGGSVGIGTTAPGTLLQVNGLISGGFAGAGSGGTNTEAEFRASGAAAPATSGTAQMASLRLSNTFSNSSLDFGSYTGGQLWIQGDARSNLATNEDIALQPNGGNVAIGTATTTAGKLTISQGSSGGSTPATSANGLVLDSNTDNGLTIMTPIGHNGNIFFDDSNSVSQGYIQYNHTASANLLRIGVGTTERMRIDNSGNVGIGTTSTAGTALTVASLAESGTNAYGLQVNAPTGATNNYAALFNGSVGINTTPSAGIGLFSGGTFSNVSFTGRTIQGSVTGNFTSGTMTNDVVGVYASSTLTAANTQNLTNAIGLSSLVADTRTATGATGTVTNANGLYIQALHSGSDTWTNYYGIRLGSFTAGTTTNAAGIALTSMSGATNRTYILVGTTTIPSGNYGIYNSSTDNNYFAGNVGIGTASPGSLLDVNGATTATSSNNYNSGAINLTGNYWNGSASAADYWSMQNVLGTGTNPTSTLTFSHSGSSGTLGISFPAPLNTASPQTTYSGSISGSAVWSMPFQGTSYKKFIINMNALHDAGGTITYPTAFVKTPYIYGDSMALAISSTNTTTFTIAAAATITGNVFVEGY